MSKAEEVVKHKPLNLKVTDEAPPLKLNLGGKDKPVTAKNIMKPVTIQKTVSTGLELDVNDATLTSAAKVLVQALPDYAREAIVDMADMQLDIPLWHYVCGVLLHAYNDGMLAVYDLDPAWADGEFGSVEPKCVVCGDDFKPARMGQKVCGQKCGELYADSQRGVAAVAAVAGATA